MPNQSKAIAFDVDKSSLISLRRALPDSLIEVVNGATAASLGRDWQPGTVELLVVNAHEDAAQTLDLCRFLVSRGVIDKDAPMVTGSSPALPQTLEQNKSQPNGTSRPHTLLLVLIPPYRKNIVSDLLKAGAHRCLMLPISAKDVAGMMVQSQAGILANRHALDVERAQAEDRWRDDGGQANTPR